jgi:hypothetical protein
MNHSYCSLSILWLVSFQLFIGSGSATPPAPQPTDLIPWKWMVEPRNSTEFHCPRPAVTLVTFAAVNLITSILAVVFGNRAVINWFTCRLCGRENSFSWSFMWVVSVGIQLLANALVALVIQRAAGFQSTFHIADLVLFYTTRPRLSWIVLGLLYARGREETGNWSSAAKQAIITEMVLELIAVYYMGRTL